MAGVILCGGKGTRMGVSTSHKVCVPIAGRAAVVRLIDTLRADGVDPIIVVVGHRPGDVVETVGAAHPGVHFVYQRDQLGTGHAARIGVEVLAQMGFDGHYVLQVKANQPELHDLLKETFDELIGGGIPGAKFDYDEDVNADHGRIETRRVWVTGWTDWYPRRREWAGLRSFICVEAVRESNNHTSIERRYYISDLLETAPTMLGYVRGHWGIENRLHWRLDVAFREDILRNRIGHSAENFSRMRRLALNLLQQDKTSKVGVKGKRLRASLDQDFLLNVLGQEKN